MVQREQGITSEERTAPSIKEISFLQEYKLHCQYNTLSVLRSTTDLLTYG